MDERTKMRAVWKLHKAVWNLSGGRLGRRVTGMPVLELVTIGHRSGQERQILITYVDDGVAPAVIGTNAGGERDPAWAKNLRAEPQARARWGGSWRRVAAVELDGAEHARIWTAAVQLNPGYEEYRNRSNRPVPIFRLESISRAGSQAET